ncbi:MAG: CPBP family intramembrane glutamic endopeptidase [Anaerolineales bacterium]
MAWIRNIFWHKEQGRPRTFWRLVGQLLILIPVLICFEIAFGICAFGFLATQGGITPAEMSDPSSVQAYLMNDPIMLILTYLGLAPSVAISVWLAGRMLDRRPFADFGFRFNKDWGVDFGFGLFLGGFLMAVTFLVEWAAGWVTVTGTFVTQYPNLGFGPALLIPLLAFVLVGFYEELFSRGYHLTNLAEGLNHRWIGPRGAILLATTLSSLIFGVLHATNPNATLFSTLNICVAGFMLAAGYVCTGELAIPMGIHITWNFFQGNVFGFPVSGANFRSATFIAIQQQGPALWTGGAFGPEGGLLGLGVMVWGVLLVILWVRWRQGEVKFHLPLAHPPRKPQEGGTEDHA